MLNRLVRLAVLATALTWAVLPTSANAAVIDKTVTINVYQMCDNAGLNCASTGPVGDDYFATSTNKIWGQAGISVSFNFVQQINNATFLTINDASSNSFAALASQYGTMGPSSSGVDMFLVNDVVGAYGEGWFGSGGLVMAMDSVMDYNCGGVMGCTGRIDTVAHELGHNFGLVPDSLGGVGGHWVPGVGNDRLMAGGPYRLVPTSLSDIAPSGLGYDKLTAGEIAAVRQSSLLRDVSPVPEPEMVFMMLAGLAGIGLMRRRSIR